MKESEGLLQAAKAAQRAIHENWCDEGECDECIQLCDAIANFEAGPTYQHSMSNPRQAAYIAEQLRLESEGDA